jgi:uncharacterized membrane protein
VHRASSLPWSLPGNLGDGYLLQHNPMFGNIRQAARALGVQFSSAPLGFYHLHALSHLPRILETKTVPYNDNVAALEWLESQAPGVLVWDGAVAPVNSLLLHESSHAIGHLQLSRRWPSAAVMAGPADHRDTAMRALMEESFANTVDHFVSCGVRDTCHRIFLTQCAYYNKEFSAALIPLKHEIGTAAAFQLIWLTYMHVNFLFRRLSPDQLQRSVALVFDGERAALPARGRAQALRLMTAACEQAFTLNRPAFRLVTANLFFKLRGIPTQVRRLLDFDFMARLERQPALRAWMDETCEIATRGIAPARAQRGRVTARAMP